MLQRINLLPSHERALAMSNCKYQTFWMHTYIQLWKSFWPFSVHLGLSCCSLHCPDSSNKKPEQSAEASHVWAQARNPATTASDAFPSSQLALPNSMKPEFSGLHCPSTQAKLDCLQGQAGQLWKDHLLETIAGRPKASAANRRRQGSFGNASAIAVLSEMAVKFHVDTGCLKLLAPKNMPVMFVAADVSHNPRGWSKDLALKNIEAKVLTADVSQRFTGWLKATARSNMLDMSRTLEVSQEPMLWSKDVAPVNMLFIFFTWAVSQSPIGWLKELAS